jgi:formate/nitrite transporter FocA (FNT family)
LGFTASLTSPISFSILATFGCMSFTKSCSLPFAETARISAIVIMTYFVGLGGFEHVVAGSTKAFYFMAAGHATLEAFFTEFWLPALIGNVIGGVLLVAVLNHAQVTAGRAGDKG